jgi:VWFA-related protein
MLRPSRAALLAAFLVWTLVFSVSPRGELRRRQTPGQTQAGQQPPPAQPQSPRPAGQTPPPDGQQPTFRAGINFVRVDVIVSDKDGNPVADLKQQDFEVIEDGKPQNIETFKLIRTDGNVRDGGEPARAIRSAFDEESEAAREDVRLFVIFLDDYHVRRGNSLGVRPVLTNFVQNQIGPLDMVAIMYPLMPVSDVRFTRNTDGLVRALNQFDGRKYDYTPRNEFEDRYANYPATTVERVRNEVSLSALKGLVTHLGALREGRKAVILVSEGYTNALPPQLRDPIASAPGYMNPNRQNPLAEDNLRDQSVQFFQDADLQTDLRLVFNEANKYNAAFYTLDPRRLTSGEFDIDQNIGQSTSMSTLRTTQDTLRVLADQTDGRALVNMNDLETGLKQMVRDSSAYYLLGYNSTQAPSDGKFHEIKVRVKRPGIQVRSRKGYWALTAEETASALAPKKEGPPPAIEHALNTIAEPKRGRIIRTWYGMTRGTNGQTQVTFVWEPIPPVSGDRREEPARVALTAANEEGHAFFRGRVPDAVVASTDATSAANAGGGTAPRGPSRVTFDVEPGTLEVRLSIEGSANQVLDTDTAEIKVPDLTVPQVTISTPRVLRATNAIEYRSLAANLDAVPTATREFRRTERVLLRFETYGPGTEVPVPTARLLNRAGQAMSDLPVATPQPGAAHQIDLPLSGLPPGEYLVEIRAKGESGEATELVPLKIAG